MDMNTNNLGLSRTSNTQLERMIDDAEWITYPLHLVVGLLKTFVYTLLFVSFLVLCFFAWMFTAQDERAVVRDGLADMVGRTLEGQT